MASAEEFNLELLSLYRRTGEATNYWPSYFLRSVRKQGGLVLAKKLLAPGQVSSGFDRLVEVRRADLSLEHIVLEPRFAHLFTAEELTVARSRLSQLPLNAFPESADPGVTAEQVASDILYHEGSVQQIVVNAYERDPKARQACIQHHGAECAICELDFETQYGEIGRGYIHVHHKRPLSSLRKNYNIDPKKDLVPVCPNCHAMLHRRTPPYDVEQLRAIIQDASKSKRN
jgi:5-methylcytosine-specific restriction protein A